MIQAHGHAQGSWLDRQLYSRHWLLLDSKVMRRIETFRTLASMVLGHAMDGRRADALGRECLSVALADASTSSAAMELAGFLMFFRAVSSNRVFAREEFLQNQAAEIWSGL